MSDARRRREWIEALQAQNLEPDRLFRLIASLSGLLDKAMIVETIGTMLGIEPVEEDDCVLFDDLSIRFGQDDKVIGMYRTIDGSAASSRTII